jgi:hypothetical protein
VATRKNKWHRISTLYYCFKDSLAIQGGLDGSVAVAATPLSPPVEPAVIAKQVSFDSQHSAFPRFTAHCFIFLVDFSILTQPSLAAG